jgi:hypothetical protein
MYLTQTDVSTAMIEYKFASSECSWKRVFISVECRLLECNTVWLLSEPTFRRKVLPQLSR